MMHFKKTLKKERQVKTMAKKKIGIIGGGISGAGLAYHLSLYEGEADVTVFEKDTIGGASTAKSAGTVCLFDDSLKNRYWDVRLYGFESYLKMEEEEKGSAGFDKTEHAEKKEPVKTETKNEFKKEHKKEKDFKKAPKKEVREETELAKVEPATIEACEKFVEDVLNAMNMEEVKVTSTVDEEGALSITMEGKNMGILIGKRGQTLDSLQYLTNRVANKMQDGYVRVKLDTEDYRRRRKETLENLAKNIASKVKRTRRTVALEPMNPYERRIIHSALQSDPAVSTHSEGEEPYRKVVVTLARRSGGSHNYEKYDK